MVTYGGYMVVYTRVPNYRNLVFYSGYAFVRVLFGPYLVGLYLRAVRVVRGGGGLHGRLVRLQQGRIPSLRFKGDEHGFVIFMDQGLALFYFFGGFFNCLPLSNYRCL